MTTLTLPWPPSDLSPNARLHFMKKHRLFQQYKAVCCASFTSQLRKAQVKFDGVFNIEFCPPDNRGRDRDNMLGAFKAGLDALAQATGLNDKCFVYQIAVGAPVRTGAVLISFDGDPAPSEEATA